MCAAEALDYFEKERGSVSHGAGEDLGEKGGREGGREGGMVVVNGNIASLKSHKTDGRKEGQSEGGREGCCGECTYLQQDPLVVLVHQQPELLHPRQLLFCREKDDRKKGGWKEKERSTRNR